MSKAAGICVILIAFFNLLGVFVALFTPSTGDGLGDALNMHFSFFAFCFLGFLVSLGFLGSVLVRWKRVAKNERIWAFSTLLFPVCSYVLLILLAAVFSS